MSRTRVLICEDDLGIRTLLKTLLTRRGAVVDSVATGAETIQRLRSQTYDLILLDVLLPDISGYDVLCILEQEQPELLMRSVVVTAFPAAFKEPLPARVAAVLRKPFDIHEFDRLIDRVLGSAFPEQHRGADRKNDFRALV